MMDVVGNIKDWATFNGWQFNYAPNSVLNLEDVIRATVQPDIYLFLLPVQRTLNTNPDWGNVESVDYAIRFMFLRKSDLDGGNRDGGKDYYFDKYEKDLKPLYDILTATLPEFTCSGEVFTNITIQEMVNAFDPGMDGLLVDCTLTDSDPESEYTPRSCGDTDPVQILDQDGNEITTVPCGDSYTVIVLSGISAGDGLGPYVNSVIAEP